VRNLNENSREIHHILFSPTQVCVYVCVGMFVTQFKHTQQQRHCGINTHSFIHSFFSLSLSGVWFFEKLCSEKSGDNVMKKYISPSFFLLLFEIIQQPSSYGWNLCLHAKF
jgi:hypothetical protein